MSRGTVKNGCVLCNGQDSTVLENCEGGYKVLKCLNCCFVYVSPAPPEGLLEKAYSEEYYTPWLGAQRKKRVRMWQSRLKTLNVCSGRKGKLLDVGCGEGLFLELAGKEGWDTTGVEFSPFAARYGRDKLGLNIFQGELTNAEFPDNTFDAVTMWHVLEHTQDPVAALREARRVLKDDGVFILAVPNLNNYIYQWVYRLVKGRKMHLFDPDDRELHLCHFTPETIRLALEKACFRVERIIPDMGIVRIHIKGLNHIARVFSILIGRIITDAIEVYAIPA
ncbi:MAG: class I SAM-dependent methyltransferase [Thermodesulfobacteriota bacterium]